MGFRVGVHAPFRIPTRRTSLVAKSRGVEEDLSADRLMASRVGRTVKQSNPCRHVEVVARALARCVKMNIADAALRQAGFSEASAFSCQFR